jgi:hypothetical protein
MDTTVPGRSGKESAIQMRAVFNPAHQAPAKALFSPQQVEAAVGAVNKLMHISR